MFAQTIRSYDTKFVVLGASNISLGVQAKWQHYMETMRDRVRADWIKIFYRAVSIYKGKVKGYSNVPEIADIREGVMKAEFKLLLREVIGEVI